MKLLMYVGVGTMQWLASPQDLFPQTPNQASWKQTLIILIQFIILVIVSSSSIMIIISYSMIQHSVTSDVGETNPIGHSASELKCNCSALSYMLIVSSPHYRYHHLLIMNTLPTSSASSAAAE